MAPSRPIVTVSMACPSGRIASSDTRPLQGKHTRLIGCPGSYSRLPGTSAISVRWGTTTSKSSGASAPRKRLRAAVTISLPSERRADVVMRTTPTVQSTKYQCRRRPHLRHVARRNLAARRHDGATLLIRSEILDRLDGQQLGQAGAAAVDAALDGADGAA